MSMKYCYEYARPAMTCMVFDTIDIPEMTHTRSNSLILNILFIRNVMQERYENPIILTNLLV